MLTQQELHRHWGVEYCGVQKENGAGNALRVGYQWEIR